VTLRSGFDLSYNRWESDVGIVTGTEVKIYSSS
jgi:hypothetical protein